MGVGLGRLLTSELAQIEHTRNLRQLALLAEQVWLVLMIHVVIIYVVSLFVLINSVGRFTMSVWGFIGVVVITSALHAEA